MINELELRKEAAKVRKMMLIFGGSFEQALGDLLDVADMYNIEKIKKTWPSEWRKNLIFFEMENNQEQK